MASTNPFNMWNMVFFNLLAENRGIKDKNPLMLTAGLATGSPMMKTVIPFQLLEKVEEAEKKDTRVKEVEKTNAQLAVANSQIKTDNEKLSKKVSDYDAALKNIGAIAEGDLEPAEKLVSIKKILTSAPVPVVPPGVLVNN